MNQSRRQFILDGAALAAVMALPSWAQPLIHHPHQKVPSEGQWVFFNGLYWDPNLNRPQKRLGPVPAVDSQHLAYLSYFTETGKSGKVNLPFLPHNVLKHPNPQKPFSVIAIPRRAKIAAEIDLQKAKVARLFYPAPGGFFYGHGAITPDHQFLLVSEVGKETALGTITVRDLRTLAVVKRISSHGYSPHEILFLNGGRSLLVCNSGSKLATEDGNYQGNPFPSTIAEIEYPSGKLLKSIACPTQNEFSDGFAHLLLLKSGDIALGTKPQQEESNDHGHLFIFTPKGVLTQLQLPEFLKARAKGQFLSLSQPELSKDLVATMPSAGFAAVFNSTDWRFKTHIELPKINGLAVDTSGCFLYANSGLGDLIKIAVSNLKITERISNLGLGGTEAHLDRIWMAPWSL